MAHARATSSPTERSEEGSHLQGRRLTKLFSLPGGKPALFLLHGFDNPNLVERIDEHGGQVTDDEAAADVILTRSRDEYKYLKDRYAVSRKTHVRMSGFVDRCIDANRFVLEPVLGKGVLRGRKPGERRTEFTEDDDEHLCQYIAEVLPEKGEGGRTGHFIYTDLMRRADQFGQYVWAQRHTQDSWRERYRKNQLRLDRRITEIVKENPPAPDGKGGYKSRRVGKLNLDDAEEFVLDAEAEADAESPTDNDDDPVLAKKASAQPQEEEEEEGGEEHPAWYQPDDEYNPRNEDHHEEDEGQEAQNAERRTRAAPTSRSKETGPKDPALKRCRAAASQRQQEVHSPNDPDETLLGPDDDDQLANVPPDVPKQSSPPGSSSEPEEEEPETQTRVRRRTAPRARPVMSSPGPPAVSVSPRRTRASARLHAANHPEPTPTPTRRRAKATTATPSSRRTRAHLRSLSLEGATRAKAKSGAATLDAVPESETPAPANDEFVAHSEEEESDELQEDDSNDMQEVEMKLRGNTRARSLSDDDLQTSKRLRRARGAPSGAAGHDEDDDDEDEEDGERTILMLNFSHTPRSWRVTPYQLWPKGRGRHVKQLRVVGDELDRPLLFVLSHFIYRYISL
ncbi:hypothetical protein EI94DRAFT_1833088 [Lactarius quietus]|nr:hypothetical protein EI94DRAFT_1833088 [Lactarius quietus]